MNLTLNGELRSVSEGVTLSGVIESLGFVAGRLACEVNGVVVRRAQWGEWTLHEGDRVEIVQMIGGG